MVSKKKNPLFDEGGIDKSVLGITLSHRSASLLMPKGDPQGEFIEAS